VTETISVEEYEEDVKHLVVAFRSCFTAPGSNLALGHLAVFCKADMTCAVPGDRDRTLINEGRREVFLLIQKFLNLTAAEITTLRFGRMRRQDNA
jgi:hypothetical protein